MPPVRGEVLRLGKFYEVLAEKELEALKERRFGGGRLLRSFSHPCVIFASLRKCSRAPPGAVEGRSLQGSVSLRAAAKRR
jgi:hypothetical protein